MNPLISVIIPTYNRLAYLKDALASVFAQTYPIHEIIVVDDGSTDGTRAAMATEPYASRICYLHQPNQRQAAARNYGISVATGEYIALLDSDDVWHPEKLARQVQAISHNQFFRPDFIFTKFEDMSSEKIAAGFRPKGAFSADYFGGSADAMLQQKDILLSSVMVRRECLKRVGKFDSSVQPSEDWDWFMRWGVVGVMCAGLHDVLVHRRRHDSNLIGNREGCYVSYLEMLHRYQASIDPELFALLVASNRNDLIGVYIKARRWRAAKKQSALLDFNQLPLIGALKASAKDCIVSVLALFEKENGHKLLTKSDVIDEQIAKLKERAGQA